jgi:hypothetical protein
MKLCLVMLLGFLFSSIPLAADEVVAPKKIPTREAARKLADQAIDLASQEKFDEAYALLKPHWPMPEGEIDELAKTMKTQWPMVIGRYGAPVANEFVRERKAGASFIELTYLQKFERHAMRWRFMFYKSADQWMVNAVSWDDGVGELFE